MPRLKSLSTTNKSSIGNTSMCVLRNHLEELYLLQFDTYPVADNYLRRLQ